MVRVVNDLRHWIVERRGGIVVAAFHNPPMNYMTSAGVAELRALIDDWADPSIRVVVLTSAVQGRFITHFSVEELLESDRDRDHLLAVGTSFTEQMHAYRLRLVSLPKPVIAAINGDAMGGGFELALACDIRIGERGDYRYGLPEARLGILPGGTGTQRLPRLVGLATAVEMILRARIFTPDEALEKGAIHELVDDARARAMEVADELALLPARSVAMIKRALYEGTDTSLAAGLRIEANALFETRLSPEAQQKMQEYVELPLDKRRGWLEGES